MASPYVVLTAAQGPLPEICQKLRYAGGMSAAPTPVLEMPKQVVIVGADALMCLGIAKCYFGDDFTFELVKLINEIVNSFSGEGPVPIMP